MARNTTRHGQGSDRSAVESALRRAGCPSGPSDFLVNPTGNFVVAVLMATAPHRSQDHRRHLRRVRTACGGAFSGKIRPRSTARRLCLALSGKERRRRRPRGTLHHPGAYAIGVADPMSLLVDLHGTGKVDEKKTREAPAADLPPDADEHPPFAQAQPADLSPHRRIRPLRPRTGQGRRLLVEKTDLVKELKGAF